MSKFDQLCKAYSKARKNYFDYRTDCTSFTTWLMTGFLTYLNCPADQLRYFPMKGEIRPGHSYTLMGAMDLEEDTFWHFGVGLTLFEKKDVTPQETVVFEFMIKRNENSYTVKMDTGGHEYHIAKDDTTAAHRLYEAIFEEIRDSYTTGLQHFLEQDETARKIGFCQDDNAAKPKIDLK